MKSIITYTLLLTTLLLSACNQTAYRKLEDTYSRPTKQVSPMSDNLKWDCKRNIVFEPGNFEILYAGLVNANEFCEKKSPPWVLGENLRNKQWHRPDLAGNVNLTDACPKYPKISLEDCKKLGYSIKAPNTDPSIGAVNVWELTKNSLDGILSVNKVTNEYKSERIKYAMYIVEGHKLPLGGNFLGRFPQGYMDDPTNRTVKSSFTNTHGLKWQHARFNNQPKPIDDPYWLYDQTEMYQADVGNYSILIYGIYEDPVFKYPDWLAKRQAFLRQWIETFKVEPLPTYYKKAQ